MRTRVLVKQDQERTEDKNKPDKDEDKGPSETRLGKDRR